MDMYNVLRGNVRNVRQYTDACTVLHTLCSLQLRDLRLECGDHSLQLRNHTIALLHEVTQPHGLHMPRNSCGGEAHGTTG